MKFQFLAVCLFAAIFPLAGQDTTPAQTKPTEHILGTVSTVDTSAGTVSVKEDKTGTLYSIQLQNTKTLLKVPPGATDLKSATRITANDLAPGDRVDVRGFKAESDPNGIAARSVILMSGRDVQQMRQQEATAWQRSTGGVVNSIDTAGQKLMITARTPEGPKPITVDAGKAQLIRYSPEHPQTPSPSQFADIQVGDQVKIIGEKSSDDASITAQKIYSGSFRTVAGTISSLSADGKSMVIKDLATKQPVTVTLENESAVRRLPPPMAYMLARRFNPDFKGALPGAEPTSGAPAGVTNAPAPPTHEWNHPEGGGGPGAAPGGGGPGGGFPRMRGANGDLSQMLDRLPKMAVTDLKSGDAVIVSGSPSPANKTVVLASNVIAGVEPIFQSASPRQMQSLGDWGNSLNMSEGAMGQQP
ncbi:MAG: hypothetical protein JO150_00505 [Acidobacteriaceae bacterium]|nr:hypothetical protein [Acidobacteriaceae bacterium]